jgi:polysaccharide pyruvyl transferase WcaK-like protein
MIDFPRPKNAMRTADGNGAAASTLQAAAHEPPARAGGKSVRASPATHRKIGLLEHNGTGNLGDDATVKTTLQHIKSRWPAATVVGLSLNPVDSEKRHGIPCFAIRQSVFLCEYEWASDARLAKRSRLPGLKARLKKLGPMYRIAKTIKNALAVRPVKFLREIVFLVRSFCLARELDLLVVCGGGQLLDWGGPWAFPYTLFKWVALAKCAGAECIFLNNGAGPLDAPLSRWFIMRALSMGESVSTRDRLSAEFLQELGFKGKITVATDNVWGLRLSGGLTERGPASENCFVIGIAPMAYGDASRHWRDDAVAYRHLIDGLSEFSLELLRRGHRIRLFSSDIWFDSKAITDLEAAIRTNDPRLLADRVMRERVADIDELLSALSRVDCYVTCRFHGVVFASLSNVPSIALAPHPKVTTLMGEMDLSHYCVNISAFSAAELTTMFDDLVANMDDVKARIRDYVAKRQSLLESQFDNLFHARPESRAEDRQLRQGGRVQ